MPIVILSAAKNLYQANKRRLLLVLVLAALVVLLAVVFWRACLAPTRILVVNATLAQQADMVHRAKTSRWMAPGVAA